MRNYLFITFLIAALLSTGCNKELELDPHDSLSTETALSTLSGIKAAVAGMYANLRDAAYYGRSMFLYGDASADDIYISKVNSNRYISTYQRNYAAVDADVLDMWTQLYTTIARANNIINNVDKVQGSAAEKDHQKGQALFIRSLVYFDLLRIFSKPWYQGNGNQPGVPLVLEADVRATPARNSVAEVYAQIIEDLQDAKTLLTATTEDDKVRASKFAAAALLSRVYLYKEDYPASITEASMVIGAGYELTDVDDLDDFYASTAFDEEIFTIRYLANENPGSNNLGNFYLKPGYGDARVSPDLISIFDQQQDVRYKLFISPFSSSPAEYQNNKFTGQEGVQGLYSPKVLRLAEIYLNRAEAYANSGQAQLALNDLNAVRTYRGLNELSGLTGDVLLEEILLERRRELMFEGHRFFDLIRNGLPVIRNYCNEATQVTSINCSLSATDDKIVAPIPQAELDANPAIRNQQNSGY